MSHALQRTHRLCLAHDRLAEWRDGRWQVPCLHCRRPLPFDADGKALGTVTVEHIVPRAWWGRRGLAGIVGLPPAVDHPLNLALACARCNHGKGVSHDPRGPHDPRARAVVEALLARRLARWREAPAAADRAGPGQPSSPPSPSRSDGPRA